MTVADTYYSRALPILKFLATRDEVFGSVTIGEIASATGLKDAEAASELTRLTFDGFLQGELRQYFGPITNGRLVGTALTEKGARAVGMWPSENLYDALLELIDRQIEMTTDEGSRSKLANLKGAMAAVGTGAAGTLLAQFLQSAPHLLH